MRSLMLRGPALLPLVFSVATALAAENDPIDRLQVVQQHPILKILCILCIDVEWRILFD